MPEKTRATCFRHYSESKTDPSETANVYISRTVVELDVLDDFPKSPQRQYTVSMYADPAIRDPRVDADLA